VDANAVIMKTTMSRLTSLATRSTSTPVASGIWMSDSSRSKLSRRSSSMARLPFSATCTS
jgi:hypothetical protein